MSDFGDAFEAGLKQERVVNLDDEPVVILKGDETAVTVASLTDRLQEHPRRKTGNLVFKDPASLILYANDHKTEQTRLFGDRDNGVIQAVFDHHGKGADLGGWCEHRASLMLVQERAWMAWTGIDRQLLPQARFVEFLEDHKRDIASPDAAELIEVCTALKGKKGVEWASGLDLRTGAIQLAYQETLEATSARKGTLEIPAHLTLGLKVYRGQEPYRVDADLRWRINEGKLGFIVALDDPDDVLDAAFADVVEGVGKATELPVLFGSP
jgi:uncharacterized protein YfdQ (DUF2303 family)